MNSTIIHKVKILVAMLAGMSLMAPACWAQGSRDALFDDEDEPAAAEQPAAKEAVGSGAAAVKGFVQLELARTTGDPDHWSKMRTRAEIGAQGGLGDGLKWKASIRADYDAVFDHTNYYPGRVEDDQRTNLMLRELYLDAGAGDWDFRLGRQHVVWGEMVGLFFADVVSARDLREFLLPDFDSMRTPQWAARAEYFQDDFHAELLWVPVATYDNIGKPGAEFYPYQAVFPGYTAVYRNDNRPSRNLNHGNYGARFSWLNAGWDVSAFYYRSMDIQPTFYRRISGADMIFEPRHDRIEQVGTTLAKDFGSVVLKGEAVYTNGRKFNVLNLVDTDGVVSQKTLDWAVGLDFTFPADIRFNVQLFQRIYAAHNPDIIPDSREDGYSLYLTKKIGDSWELQATWISSLNRNDWLFRPRVQWNFQRNWRLLVGADVFHGPAMGLFGQYSNRDRLYSEVRYSF